MNGGYFIPLYDEETLKLYLKRGVYGFLMKPILDSKINPKSRHFQALADFACSRDKYDVFFFLNRKIYYGGQLTGKEEYASFYVNGENSPLSRKHKASLFWDESNRYKKTANSGIFNIIDKDSGYDKKQRLRCQPYMLIFNQTPNTGKYILSDDLYFQLGNYPYPLPSNSIQNMGFCTITPGEVDILKKLIFQSKDKIDFKKCHSTNIQGTKTSFDYAYVDLRGDFVNEAELEFTLLSSLDPISKFLSGNYILCRQVPISPFKPYNMDKADICLYDILEPISDGTIPNVVIELKKEKANKNAYRQVVRYLSWLEKIAEDDFEKITAMIISKSFVKIKRSDVDDRFDNKIIMYSLDEDKIIKLV